MVVITNSKKVQKKDFKMIFRPFETKFFFFRFPKNYNKVKNYLKLFFIHFVNVNSKFIYPVK